MKKTFLFFLTTVGLFCSECTRKDITIPKPVVSKVDYDQVSIELMQDLAPQIVGTWTLQKVLVKHNPRLYTRTYVKLTGDSTFLNLAKLTIQPAAVPRSIPRDLRRGEYDGTLEYGGKTYPVQFDLRADFSWLVNRKGPQGIFLFQYRFPNGSHIVEPEEAFLKDLGLIDDNFSLEISAGKPAMVWHGFNRGVERIDLVKQ
ncbi:hypothetical protein [Larkinella rosea]|uniref:Uncharacterized protein n=1 Tax=Larkinella rosea TaxID=2025312 RepID=A0A3P1BC99_9BACT|nr:hypothetical protein [Larkinella rosea]RRA98659.1 hypothetical protein EHT25_27045 [Larkinella rosea]